MYIVPIKTQCKLNPKSHKSPIRLKCSSIRFLKEFNESHSTTDGGKLFNVVAILCEKIVPPHSNFGASYINKSPLNQVFSNEGIYRINIIFLNYLFCPALNFLKIKITQEMRPRIIDRSIFYSC